MYLKKYKNILSINEEAYSELTIEMNEYSLTANSQLLKCFAVEFNILFIK